MLNSNWMKWANDVHDTAYSEIAETREQMKLSSPEELTDIGFICKKMYEQVDDLRKEIQRLQDLAERLACLKGEVEGKPRFAGTLATGTPSVSMSANIPHPKKNPEQYTQLCDYLGVPEQMVQWDLFRIHWPGFKEFFTAQMAAGKPVPPGVDVDKTHAHYKLRYRGRR